MAPLSGIRILDLTRLIPGAFATLMLAELGAEVIKIEDPKGGDPTRDLPPSIDGHGLYHLLLNRGKRSVALDLRLPSSKPMLDKLIDNADVMIESFRPNTARAIGVSAGQVRATRPRLVHCAITGYGQTGPYAERPGHDLNYVAEAGLLAADRPRATDLPRMFIADVGGGAMNAVAGILAALFARERTGEGASLDISMHDAMVYWMMLPAARELVDRGADAVGELPTFGDHASYNLYDTSDGRRLALGALEPKFWQRFCEVIERRDLIPRQHTGPEDQRQLIEEVRGIFRTRTSDDWLRLFDAREVCLSPLNTAADVLADPHVAARGLVSPDSHGVRAFRSPFVAEPVALAPAPALGADTAAVLANITRGQS
jgi:crotonobetainyl-CoA:carnitine CoA-transferase CaiB-like acyl-CoA transferase